MLQCVQLRIDVLAIQIPDLWRGFGIALHSRDGVSIVRHPDALRLDRPGIDLV
jgi:hypothetical protein